jgi:hypothetical protein
MSNEQKINSRSVFIDKVIRTTQTYSREKLTHKEFIKRVNQANEDVLILSQLLGY